MFHPRVFRVALAALVVTGAAAGCGATSTSDGEAAAKDPKKAPATTTVAPADPTTTVAPAADPTTTTTAMEGQGDPIPDEPAGPTEAFSNVSDPVNAAFSVDVPDGWDNLVYSVVEGQVTQYMVNAVSPDGGTILFLGDPKIPSYWNPATAHEVTRSFCDALDFMELQSYTPATEYGPAYVDQKFSELPGYAQTEVVEDFDEEAKARDQWEMRGLTVPTLHIVDVHFTYETEAGEPVNAVVNTTTIDSGDFWQASVRGLSTTGSVEDYDAMLTSVVASVLPNPEWTALQNARHEQTMADIAQRTAEMTSQHQANMAAIQSSAARHQQKMEGLWAAGDASVANFYDRMEAGDANQRSFLNYINDENTVAGSSGQTYQVDNSYDRYWMNTATGSYVGGDINFDDTELRELGLNPSDYEEVQVVR